MIQIYFDSGKIPVRYPLYICMFNLARIISFESLDSEDALNHSIAILMVGLALLALAGRKYIRDINLKLPRISELRDSFQANTESNNKIGRTTKVSMTSSN